MSGPQQERLRSMLQGANKQLIQAAYQEWRAGSELLLAVSTTLHGAAPRIQDQFGRTGPAAARAFGTVAGKVAERSSQMSAAGDALVAALDVIAEAERLRDRFDAAPLTEPSRPTPSPGPSTPEDVAARKQYDSRKAGYDAAHADREAQAAATADRMDLVFADSTQTMKRIHGDPDPVPQHQQADGPGGTGRTGSSSTGTGSSSGYRPPSGGHQTHATATATSTATHADEPPTSTTSTPHGPSSGASPLPPGTAQGGNEPFPTGVGPTPPGPVGGVPTGGTAPTGLTVPTAGGLAGALGGGALGGLTGISGAVRGSSVVPTGSAAGGRVTGTTGGRAIGSTARTGAATTGTLGRSTAAGSGGTARGAATGTQRGSGTRGGTPGRTGSRGAAGGRGTAGTAGAQGGRSRKDPRKKGTDFFAEEQDWVEDEGAAPGVID